MRLLPREERFFALFLDQVATIRKASGLLAEAVTAGNSKLTEASHAIRELEAHGDEIIHDVFVRLNQTFITPLDPEDIHSLASHLDDVLDGIEDAAYRMVAYRLEPIPPSVLELCRIVDLCAQELEGAFRALNSQEAVLPHCIEINRLEDEADAILRAVVVELFASSTDPIALIKQKEVHEFLEQTTDRCEDVADVLQAVVVKNS
jgi:predicted phosphate transport protein (TIGR00153 family)